MTQELLLERRRTAGDVVLGAVLSVTGLVILGHTVIATLVSVVFLGWMLLVGGVCGLAAALFHLGRGGFWPAALTGGLSIALGVIVLRNPAATAVTLTLVAGTLFLASGVVRLIAAVQEPQYRVPLALSGAVSTLLGLLVVFNLFTASLTLLGVMLGVQTLVDGITTMLVGRVREVSRAHEAVPA